MTLRPSSSAFVSFLGYRWLFNVATSFVNGPVLNVKVLVGTFNQEKAFSMSVKLRQHQFSSSSVEGRRKSWCWCVAIYRAVTGHRVLAQRDTGPCPPSPHLSSPHLTHRKHRHMCCVDTTMDIHQAKQKQQ